MHKLANFIWRDFNTPNVPASGAHEPKKYEIRHWGTWVEDRIEGAVAGRVVELTWAALAATQGTREGQPARVVGPDAGTHTDPVTGATVENVGEYTWSISPEGWRRYSDIERPLVRASNNGAGTANNVEAQPDRQFSRDPYKSLITLNFTEPNTGPMTVSIGGETPRDLVTNVSQPIPAGYIQAGMSALLQIDENGAYRMFSYGDAQAIEAAAEKYANYAELWAQSPDPIPTEAGGDGSTDHSSKWWAGHAQDYAAMAGSATGLLFFPTVQSLLNDTTLSYTAGAGLVQVAPGDIVHAQSFRYEVAAETNPSPPSHITTAGGVNLYEAGPVFTDIDRMARLPASSTISFAELTQDGRAGTFVWDDSDLSTQVNTDTNSAIYVPPASDSSGASGAWVRQYTEHRDAHAGISGSSVAADWQGWFDILEQVGATHAHITADVTSLDGPVDCKGIRLIANDSVLPSSTDTFVNHGGVENGIIAGVHTSRSIANTTSLPTAEKTKFIRRAADQTYLVYTAKQNPEEGYLEFRSQDNVTTTTNSIGGNCASRIVGVQNINEIVGYKHEYASTGGHTPTDSQTRPIGSGTGGVQAAFWDIPSGGGVLRFNTSHVVEEVSILFMLTPGSSNSVDILFDGNTLDTISLVRPNGGPDWFIYRKQVIPGESQISIVNNGTSTAYVAGINCYKPAEEFPSDIDIDTLAYSRNSNDYTHSQGAVDYALRRHPDDYGGSDPTGGSYHGGETIISQSVRLDDGNNWSASSAIGDVTASRQIKFVSNVNVVWGDGAEVNVVRFNHIGDGSLFKEVRIIAGTMVFDAVWTTMWTTPDSLSRAWGLTSHDISGVSAEFRCYERGNEVLQDTSGGLGIRNSWTLFSDERNSNGGPYIASENTRNKLYYGPILFNKGQIGEIHCQQHTEFFGTD